MSKIKIAPYRVTSQIPDSDYGVTVAQVRCYSRGRQLLINELNPITISDFDQENDPLRIEMKISINMVENLFDPSPEAVTTKGSRLGVALFWESRESGQRGVGSCHYLDESSQFRDVILSLDFNSGDLREEMDFTPKVFLDSVGKILPGYSSIKGALLGNLDKKQTIILSGNGSKFPLYEASEGRNAPLWRVQMDWNDPLEDSFVNHFKIIINIDHSDYHVVRRIENPCEGQDVVPVALKEIVTSSLFGMMVKLKDGVDDWHAIMDGKSEPKSVGELAWAYKEHESWNLVSPADLLQDIRKTVESAGIR